LFKKNTENASKSKYIACFWQYCPYTFGLVSALKNWLLEIRLKYYHLPGVILHYIDINCLVWTIIEYKMYMNWTKLLLFSCWSSSTIFNLSLWNMRLNNEFNFISSRMEYLAYENWSIGFTTIPWLQFELLCWILKF
jgi:hypothetical protein